MSNNAEGVEINTRTRKIGGGFGHKPNADRLRIQFGYIDAVTRLRLLNIIEANARHWYTEAGGSVQNFERLFNNENHGEK